MVLHIIRADILLIATQLAKCPRVLYAKPSIKIYLLYSYFCPQVPSDFHHVSDTVRIPKRGNGVHREQNELVVQREENESEEHEQVELMQEQADEQV